MPIPTFGDNPQVNRGAQSEYKRLFFSESDIALLLNKGLHSGNGVLEEGTILGKHTIDGILVPCPKTAWTAVPDPAYALLTADQVSGEATFKVSLEDSYKFKVGDSIVLRNNSTTPVYHDGGLITTITLNATDATITMTTATSVATFTTANVSNAYLKTKASSPFKAAYGILSSSVDTGYGSNSGVGAGAGVILSNAILYIGALVGYDSTALADLTGSVADGQYLILK